MADDLTLTGEDGDPQALAPDVTPIDWRPKQRAYEASRRRYRALNPIREVKDFTDEG